MSEEHKEQKKKHFKMSKWVILTLVVVVIAAAAIYLGFSYVSLAPTVAANKAPTSNELAKFTTTGTELIATETTQNVPYFESATLDAGRYSVQVTSSTPVWIRVYDQLQFNDWQSTKNNGSTKAGTNLGESDKVTSFNRNFDVNKGEEGKYYLLILGSGSASLQLRITQISKFS